jgi:hypothetical protein
MHAHLDRTFLRTSSDGSNKSSAEETADLLHKIKSLEQHQLDVARVLTKLRLTAAQLTADTTTSSSSGSDGNSTGKKTASKSLRTNSVEELEVASSEFIFDGISGVIGSPGQQMRKQNGVGGVPSDDISITSNSSFISPNKTATILNTSSTPGT